MLPSGTDPDETEESSLLGYKKRYEVNEINLLNFGDTLLLLTDGLMEHDEGRFFPGVVEKLDIGYDVMKAANPDIVLGGGRFEDGQLFNRQMACGIVHLGCQFKSP